MSEKMQTQKIETYGRQNSFVKSYFEIKSAFQIHPFAKERLNSFGLEPYLPKIKRWRVALGLFAFGLLAITPFTPEVLLLPIIVGWVLK